MAEPPRLWFVKMKNDRPAGKILLDEKYAEGGNVEHQPNGLDLTLRDAGGADLEALAADQLARVLPGDDGFVRGQVGINGGAFLYVDRLRGLDVTLQVAQDPDAPVRAQSALELVIATDDRLVDVPGTAATPMRVRWRGSSARPGPTTSGQMSSSFSPLLTAVPVLFIGGAPGIIQAVTFASNVPTMLLSSLCASPGIIAFIIASICAF